MIEITRDLKDIVICGFRYALGRKTYVTGLTAEFIIKHPELIDKRVKQVMLNDLKNYFEFRKTETYVDDECDYQSWLMLENWLRKL